MSKKWYVVQAYSGFEKNVQKALKDRIEREGDGCIFWENISTNKRGCGYQKWAAHSK